MTNNDNNETKNVATESNNQVDSSISRPSTEVDIDTFEQTVSDWNFRVKSKEEETKEWENQLDKETAKNQMLEAERAKLLDQLEIRKQRQAQELANRRLYNQDIRPMAETRIEGDKLIDGIVSKLRARRK